MSLYRIQPPWEFLLSASRNSLQSYELSRLNHAADLRKEMTAMLDQWIEENSAAMLARWLLQNRDRETREAKSAVETPANGETGDAGPVTAGASASDNFLADRGVNHAAIRHSR